MKIKDLDVNQSVELTLVVVSATPRETKAGKPFLALEFFDGVDTIKGNYWDWLGANIPEKNAVLDVVAQVTEWLGAKQLNVRSLKTNHEVPIAAFAPTSTHNASDVYSEAYALMSNVNDDFLRDLALHVLDELQMKWLTVPGAKTVHHAYLAGTLVHCLSVARIANAIAHNVQDANVDLCTVGGMLHDVGKLFSYTVSGVSIENTDDGMLADHTYLGAATIDNFAKDYYNLSKGSNEKIDMLRHIILSHHGKLEYGAAVTPACIEAYIVHHADDLDATVEQIRAASSKATENAKWTDRLWTLGNKPHLTTQYVDSVMEWTSVE